MAHVGDYHDLLFEVSNEDRHKILLSLQRDAKRQTDLTKTLGLTSPEIRRHVNRLLKVGLILKDVKGFYHNTPYGEAILLVLQEILFLSTHKDYFSSHRVTDLPEVFVKSIGALAESTQLDDVLGFLHSCESVIKNSEKYVWFIVNQFPLNFLDTINDVLKKNVKIKIIESRRRKYEAVFESLVSEEVKSLNQLIYAPLIEQKVFDHGGVFLCLSEKECTVSFPVHERKVDYKGFITKDPKSIDWCKSLFEYYWKKADTKKYVKKLDSEPVDSEELVAGEIITVEGTGDPEIDVDNVQDAVDHYSEVILKGRFNLGNNAITITRSIVLRGEGRENGIPLTKVKKQGWEFPFITYDKLLYIRGKEIDVKIENIHFTDFNNTCILAMRGNSVTILDNRFTLASPVGRGMKWSKWGNQISGVVISGELEKGGFPGESEIKGNYIDFGLEYLTSGFYSRNEQEDDPQYRIDLDSHLSYVSYGIIVNRNLGQVIVEDNDIKNVNFAGIRTMDNWSSSHIVIRNNRLSLGVYGSYALNSEYAGYGIYAHGYWSLNKPDGNYSIEIENNEILCKKVNYCGVSVVGHSRGMENVESMIKLSDGSVNNNSIHLDDGAVGILLDRCDNFTVTRNSIHGTAYYGIQVSGSEPTEKLDLGAINNSIITNDMEGL